MITKGMNVGNATFFDRIKNRLNGIDGAKREIAFVLVVYLASVALHYCLTNFDKTLSVYMDEVLYFEMARSLYNGQGLLVRGLTMDFQKVAYSLLLAPFFSIGDPVLRLKIMSLFNCVLIISSVFPMYLITKELGLKRKTKYIVIALTAFWPDMLLSCTFMAENLYWPLFLFSVYIFIRWQKTQRIRYAVIQGVICYLGYFCKEHFLAVVLTYIGLEVCYPFAAFLATPKKSRQSLKTSYSEHFTKKRVIGLAVFVLTFAVCLIAVKLVFFSDVNSIYYKPNETLISFDPYKLLYLFYAFFYYLAAMLISVFVLPLIYPIFKFSSCDDSSRKLICFSYIYLLMMAAIIAFQISINEDLGDISPRVHLRYIEPCLLIVIMLFFNIIQDREKNIGRVRQIGSWIAAGVASIFACLIYKGAGRNSQVDQFVLYWYDNFVSLLGKFRINGKDTLVIYFGSFVTGAVITLFVLAMHYIYIHQKSGKRLTGIFAALLMILCIDNAYIHYTQILQPYQYVPAEMIDEVLEMNQYFSEQPENCSVLYVVQGKGNYYEPSRCFDTYFEKKSNVYCIGDKLYKEISSNDSVPVGELNLHEPMWDYEYQTTERIDYVIIASHLDISSRVLANARLVDELRNDAYHIYKITDTDILYFEDNRDFAFTGGTKTISFLFNDHNISEYVVKGIRDSTWLLNDFFRTEIPVIGEYDELYVSVKIFMDSELIRYYEIRQDNEVIQSGKISGFASVSFKGRVTDGRLTFNMYMLDTPDLQTDKDDYSVKPVPENYLNMIMVSEKPAAQ